VSRLRLFGAVAPEGFARAALRRLNALPHEEAAAELLRCCGSRSWAGRMAERRPFRDRESLLAAADAVWREAGREDRLEAFRAHPRIGSTKDLAHQSGAARAWAESEQKGARDATATTTEALARVNREYEERFGHIYIVCATGKTADEMLALARSRLGNDAAKELDVAAEEQRKITRIRLEKLLSP
jgi:allantoicase